MPLRIDAPTKPWMRFAVHGYRFYFSAVTWTTGDASHGAGTMGYAEYARATACMGCGRNVVRPGDPER